MSIAPSTAVTNVVGLPVESLRGLLGSLSLLGWSEGSIGIERGDLLRPRRRRPKGAIDLIPSYHHRSHLQLPLPLLSLLSFDLGTVEELAHLVTGRLR